MLTRIGHTTAGLKARSSYLSKAALRGRYIYYRYKTSHTPWIPPVQKAIRVQAM